MAQFTASQSINGLQTFSLFTAPTTGAYFIDGKLQLPLSTGAGPSAVVAVIKQNASTVYTGAAGSTGFSLPALALTAADVVTVILTSASAVDNVTNAVTGVVSCGNAF